MSVSVADILDDVLEKYKNYKCGPYKTKQSCIRHVYDNETYNVHIDDESIYISGQAFEFKYNKKENTILNQYIKEFTKLFGFDKPLPPSLDGHPVGTKTLVLGAPDVIDKLEAFCEKYRTPEDKERRRMRKSVSDKGKFIANYLELNPEFGKGTFPSYENPTLKQLDESLNYIINLIEIESGSKFIEG